MQDRGLRKLIDACRAGSDDLHQPELKDLARAAADDDQIRDDLARLQRLDSVISQALQSVAIPDQLEDRIIANLTDHATEMERRNGEQDRSVLLLEIDEATKSGPDDPVSAQTNRMIFGWTTRSVVLCAAAASVTLLLFVWQWFDRTTSINVDSVVMATAKWRDSFVGEGSKPETAPRTHPVSSNVIGRTDSWAKAGEKLNQLDRQAVVYRIDGPASRHSLLFVIRPQSAMQLPILPPKKPHNNTGGWSVSAWQEGPLMYVLMVPGTVEQYRNSLRQRTTA